MHRQVKCYSFIQIEKIRCQADLFKYAYGKKKKKEMGIILFLCDFIRSMGKPPCRFISRHNKMDKCSPSKIRIGIRKSYDLHSLKYDPEFIRKCHIIPLLKLAI